MVTLKKAEAKHLPYIKELYKTAFPRSDRKPFRLLEKMQKMGCAEILIIQDEESPLGLAISLFYQDMVLLDYFAVDSRQRGQGIGSSAIACIKQRYADKRLLLEIELPDENAPDNQQRIRRKAFYHKNGLQDAEIKVCLMGVDMELLTNGCSVTFAEYYSIYQNTVGPFYTKVVGITEIV